MCTVQGPDSPPGRARAAEPPVSGQWWTQHHSISLRGSGGCCCPGHVGCPQGGKGSLKHIDIMDGWLPLSHTTARPPHEYDCCKPPRTPHFLPTGAVSAPRASPGEMVVPSRHPPPCPLTVSSSHLTEKLPPTHSAGGLTCHRPHFWGPRDQAEHGCSTDSAPGPGGGGGDSQGKEGLPF